MNAKAKKLDKLHLEYESLLLQELETLIPIGISHGWKSRLYAAGLNARNALRKAGSKIPDEQS